ncbi:MAG TPA: PhnD/SsuA/transferrin family substrate-binding protein [Paracoccaceae bacterium]|nr:PhnD/SsuA/transferrin family substrate-binding protein [Paracoccaceae bacterium]HMO70565.1 PhnD/SsuA/transferrin family substrate-binding protein [Paracoccaceae bacterium]
MIAALGMYDPGPVQAANDRLWALVRDGLRARGLPAPEALTRGEGAYWPAWTAPDLVLAQTCGFPYRARLHGRVALVATPDHGLPGCPPGHYHSLFIVRADNPRDGLEGFGGARLAFNEALSQSGWAAPVCEAANRGIALRAGPCTGSHLASAQAVAQGVAEIAAVDAVTWAILTETGLAPPGLRVLAATPPTPALPYIAAIGADTETTFAALAAAVAALAPEDRAALHLRGVVRIPAAHYLAVPTPPPPEPGATA